MTGWFSNGDHPGLLEDTPSSVRERHPGFTCHDLNFRRLGKEKVPLQGARIDVAFEGDIKGRIAGKVRSGVSTLRLGPLNQRHAVPPPEQER